MKDLNDNFIKTFFNGSYYIRFEKDFFVPPEAMWCLEKSIKIWWTAIGQRYTDFIEPRWDSKRVLKIENACIDPSCAQGIFYKINQMASRSVRVQCEKGDCGTTIRKLNTFRTTRRTTFQPYFQLSSATSKLWKKELICFFILLIILI